MTLNFGCENLFRGIYCAGRLDIYAFVPGRTRLSFFFSLTYVLPDIMKVTCMYACIHVCLCTVDAFLSTLYVYIARVYVCLPVCLSNYV